jgi:hypothetical protein
VRSIGSDLHMDYTAVGETTHVAARMEQMALPGSILLSAQTLASAEGYVEVKPLGPLPVKGLEASLDVYELTGAAGIRSRFQTAAIRGLTRFVGRESELEQLGKALQRVEAGHGQVVAVVGEAGVGKSRLYWEFTHTHRAQLDSVPPPAAGRRGRREALSAGARPRDGARDAPPRRPLPLRPRQASPAHGPERTGAGAPPHGDDDVPRDGDDVLAGGGGGDDERAVTLALSAGTFRRGVAEAGTSP